MEAASVPAGHTPQKRRSRGLSERRLAAVMTAPSLVVIGLVAVYPIGYAIWLSLNQYSVRVPGLSRFVGLGNYSDALSSPDFWSSFKNTIIFTVASVSLELMLGIAMAVAMHQAFKGRGLLRTVVLVPWAVLPVVAAITCQTIFEPNLGPVNQIFSALGLPGANRVWLGEDGWAMAVLVFADVWKTAPFMALLLLAGLQVIPDEVYDAAKVDGATTWQRFVRV